MALGILEKEIMALVTQLAEQLTSNQYQEAYASAGALHAKLKGDVVVQLPIDTIQEIKAQLRFYYKHNEEYNNASRKLYGTGKKLESLVVN